MNTKKDRVLYGNLNRSLSSWFGNLPDLCSHNTIFLLENQGQIDDTRIYNYPLTATQVKTLYLLRSKQASSAYNDGATRYGPTTGAP